MSQFLRIKEWDKFQHYKDRNPPWIKLHRELLTSRTWVELDDAGRVLAIACMVLAAETGNKIPLDGSFIQRRAYLKSKPDVQCLISLGFAEVIGDQVNTDTASKPYQMPQKSIPETEEETEKEGEEESLAELPPEGLHPLSYARKICEEIGLPVEGNMRIIASSIEAVMNLHKLSVVGAHIHLLGRAKDAVARGEEVTKFWFQDAKWRKVAKGGNKRDEEFAAAHARSREVDGEDSGGVSKFSARSSG